MKIMRPTVDLNHETNLGYKHTISDNNKNSQY